MSACVAGVDCSTQSTKVVCVDVETGQVLSSARAEHTVLHPSVGASETDPSEWEDALAAGLHATRRASDIAAISVAGQQHGLCVLDSFGRPLRPALLWNDTRSAPQADALRDSFGASWWASEIGVVPVASFTATKWEWLCQSEPDVAARVAAVRLPHDLLVERLCGRGATDRGDASGTAWWSVVSGSYSSAVLDAIALPAGVLPEVLGPREAAGVVTAEAASRFGLAEGTLVGCGTGDNAGAALGLGLGVGEVAVSLGTSGTAYAVTDAPACDPSGVVAGFADATGRYLPLAATLNATLAVDRFAEWLGLTRDEAASSSGGVVVAPFLDGERTPNLPSRLGDGDRAAPHHHPRGDPALGLRGRRRVAARRGRPPGRGRGRPDHPDRRRARGRGRTATSSESSAGVRSSSPRPRSSWPSAPPPRPPPS